MEEEAVSVCLSSCLFVSNFSNAQPSYSAFSKKGTLIMVRIGGVSKQLKGRLSFSFVFLMIDWGCETPEFVMFGCSAVGL